MNLRGRIGKLEERTGGEPCARCSGFRAVVINGELHSASRNGEKGSLEEWAELEGGMVEGRCPECGRKPLEIRVPSRFDRGEGAS